VEAELKDARILDLFAGTGAVGLEALSRGAASVDFVERNPAALHALKGNVARLRAQKSTRIFKKDALGFLDAVEPGSYDLVFADPPYTSSLAARVAELWLERRFAPVLLLEAPVELEFPGRPKRKVTGDTALVLYRSRRR
jgi:16S rRNA (guanine966-N2)-methyltransferase